jgi:hypothetical protein
VTQPFQIVVEVGEAGPVVGSFSASSGLKYTWLVSVRNNVFVLVMIERHQTVNDRPLAASKEDQPLRVTQIRTDQRKNLIQPFDNFLWDRRFFL